MRQAMAHRAPSSPTPLPTILRYGIAVLSVAIATGFGFFVMRHFEAKLTPFLFAVAATVWYAGTGPGVLAIVLAVLSLNYIFLRPFFSFSAISYADLVYLTFCTLCALAVGWVSGVRRRAEQELRQARDRLQIEVQQRAQRENEIKNLNQELAKRAEELEATNKDLESFSYSVSHDLRSPLRHLTGFSELLQKQSSSLLDDKSLRYLQTIVASAKRMGNLIDDLLALSRVGRTEAKKVRVNLEQLVNEVVAELSQETRGRQIDWKIGALPVCYGDRSMLKLAVVNLLSNAVKFTRMRTTARIEIGSALRNNEPEMFVRDNGVGFDMQYANKLFGVFQRLHLAEEFEGTGIGLATVQRVIQRHGGKVRGEGAVDQGATFYFSLPDATDAAERTATHHERTDPHFDCRGRSE
jgi:signal transduction histidine kinase